MRLGLGGIGLRGALVLAVTGIVGAILAAHGWSGRQTPAVLGSIGRGPSAIPERAGATPRSAPSGTPAPASSPGPLLSSQSFAQYAFVVWPGRPGPAHYYPLGARVYVIEASLGDDSGNTDYNLGDDGIIVTDAHGRIVT
jgi:hypothetical protein